MLGHGKTVVAMCSAYKAVKSGYQAAIMAPTAILATQHYENFKNLLDELDIKCELLISGITKKKKEDILERLKNGEIDILIGTHAIIEDNVIFKNLGLVVTDEQHRFGVKQRTKIAEKGQNVDVLVMTATPIPRTLALILYGDLDISIIDELPPNRKKIETYAVNKKMTDRVNVFIEKQIKEGRQASCNFDVRYYLENKQDLKNVFGNNFMSAYKHYLNGKNIAVLLSYANALGRFGDWYCQLWAESLGKRNLNDNTRVGQTPVTAIGTSVQHSQFQLYLDGPSDKVITVLGVENFRNDLEYYNENLNEKVSFEHLIKTERDASIQVLYKNNIPCEFITLSKMNENNLGKLFVFYLFKTIFSGALLGVNPYGQPAVESVKQTIKRIYKDENKLIFSNSIKI